MEKLITYVKKIQLGMQRYKKIKKHIEEKEKD
jgi:hypothetical protein